MKPGDTLNSSHARDWSRLLVTLSLILLAILATVLSGCTRTATHEPGNLLAEYDSIEPASPTQQLSYQLSSTQAYNGTQSAVAHYESGNTANTDGVYNLGTASGSSGYYGAAFYFPEGTFTGASPKQKGRIDVMRWDNAGSSYDAGDEYGGISISASDHRARLVKGQFGPTFTDVDPSSTDQIGSPFRLQEGCWNWIVVRQRLSNGGSGQATPINDVYLNGTKVVDSSAGNGDGQSATNVRFGLPGIETVKQQGTPIDVYVDDAYASDTELQAPGDNTCDPPRSRYGSTAAGSWVPDGGSGDAPQINAIKPSGDKVYVGGDFSYFGQRTGSFVSTSSSGAYDQHFPEVAGNDFSGTSASPSSSVRAIAPDGSGGWYIGGDFTSVGGLPRQRLAHILPNNGGVDPNWNPGADGVVYALVVSGQDVYVGGSFTNIGGQPRNRLAKLDASTAAVSPWNPNASGSVRSMALSGTDLYVGGTFTTLSSFSHVRLGAVDIHTAMPEATWNPSANGPVTTIVPTLNAIYVGGGFTTVNSTVTRNRLAAIDPYGTASVLPWNPSAIGGSVDTIVLSGTKAYVGGGFTSIGGQLHNGIAAVDLGLGNAFGWNPALASGNRVSAIALSGSDVYLGGDFTSVNANVRRYGASVDSITAQLTSWNPNLGNKVEAIGISPSGGIYAGGRFRAAGVVERDNLAELDAASSTPTSWAPNPNARVNALELAADHNLYVGGNFTSIAGQPRQRLASFDSTTDNLSSWEPQAAEVYTLATALRRLYVGSASVSSGSVSQANVAAVFLGGSLDTSWDPQVNGVVKKIVASSEAVYMAGSFTSIKGYARSGLGAVVPRIQGGDLEVWPWAPDPDGEVLDMSLTDKNLYVAGRFTHIAGKPRAHLAAFTDDALTYWNPPLTSWDPAPNGDVESVASDGTVVVVGGRFSSVSDVPRSGLAVLDPGNGDASPFAPQTGWPISSSSASFARALAVAKERLYVGGNFYSVGADAQAGLARFESPGFLLDPMENERTRRRLTIKAKAQDPHYDKVELQFRRGTGSAWAAVPSGLMADDQNQPLGSWPVSLSTGLSPTMVWDVPSTAGINGEDGSIYVRAIFSGSGGATYASDSVKVTLNQKGRGTDDATEAIGPGSVDLLTGNFSVTRDDVSINSFISDLTVSRTYNSRDASAGSGGPFGPGWLSSLPVDSAQSNYVKLTSTSDVENGDFVNVTATDGTKFSFWGIDGSYWPEPGSEDLQLTRPDGSSFELSDVSGNTTVFKQQGGSDYLPTEVVQPGSGTSTSFGYDSGKIVHMFAPSSSPCSVTNPTEHACRFLTLVYADHTTATGSSSDQWGDFVGQVSRIKLTAYDPATQTVTPSDVADYSYDSLGRLRAAWDPRISPALQETYNYDTAGRLTTITPPGTQPWTITYLSTVGDPSTGGRLFSVNRPALPGTATWTMAYNVPLNGQGAPYDMSPSAVAAWAQQAVPTDATAIFPPDQVPGNPPSDYSRATVHYLDRKAREVNVTSPGGYTTTTEWDDHNNPVRELTAANRALAIQAGSNSATVARTLDTQRTYSSDGIELRDVLEPRHEVQLPDGSRVSARKHITTEYETIGPVAHLPYRITEAAKPDGSQSDVDARVTEMKYVECCGEGSAQFRSPTEVIVDAVPGGLNYRTRYRYTLDGQVDEKWLPASNGNDARATETLYYSADGSGGPGCTNKPEWVGMPCLTRPKAQPGTPGLPDLPTTTYEYNRLLQPTKEVDSVGGTTRTTTTGYDLAGRQLSADVSSTEGAPLPQSQTGYDPTTGQPATTSITEGSPPTTRQVSREYDGLGRLKRYTDSDGSSTDTTYDLLGRVATTQVTGTQGIIGSQTSHYDPVSGLLTQLDDSAAGSFSASYDADGQITTENYSDSAGNYFLQAQSTYDETGSPTHLRYVKTANCSASCTWLDFQVHESIHGQWMAQDGTLSHQDYTYDQVGRLTQVKDTPSNAGCTTRAYAYDADSNRAAQMERAPLSGGGCDPSGTGQVTHGYDSADRITDSGVAYDTFGRIKTLPGSDAGGSQANGIDATYYVNDLVRSLQQDGVTHTLVLDPARRPRMRQVTGQSDETIHYSDASDSPSWTSKGGTWQRYIEGIDSDLVAIQDSATGVKLQLSDLHGDVVATASLDSTATAPSPPFEATEFGVPRQTADHRYSWLGSKQRQTELPSGVVDMGTRVYVPQLGRFLQPDPVPGGSANEYDYANQDPLDQYDLSGTKARHHQKQHSDTGHSSPNRITARASSPDGPHPFVLRQQLDWLHYLRKMNRPTALERAVSRVTSRILHYGEWVTWRVARQMHRDAENCVAGAQEGAAESDGLFAGFGCIVGILTEGIRRER